MEISQLIPHVEALIFAADRPLPVPEISELLNNAMAFLEDRATNEQVETAIEAIKEKYNSEFYAFEIRESGGGYQFLTKKEYYQTVAQLNGEKFLKRLSTAALETLAIVAYRQPISKGEIEHIRGVSTDYSIQKLLEKDLIVISGRSEELPGKPLLYSTSKAFMDYFGLNSPDDLPKLKEVFDEDLIQPTLIDGNGDAIAADAANGELDESGRFVVSNDGELRIEAETIILENDDAAEFPQLSIDENAAPPDPELLDEPEIWTEENLSAESQPTNEAIIPGDDDDDDDSDEDDFEEYEEFEESGDFEDRPSELDEFIEHADDDEKEAYDEAEQEEEEEDNREGDIERSLEDDEDD